MITFVDAGSRQKPSPCFRCDGPASFSSTCKRGPGGACARIRASARAKQLARVPNVPRWASRRRRSPHPPSPPRPSYLQPKSRTFCFTAASFTLPAGSSANFPSAGDPSKNPVVPLDDCCESKLYLAQFPKRRRPRRGDGWHSLLARRAACLAAFDYGRPILRVGTIKQSVQRRRRSVTCTRPSSSHHEASSRTLTHHRARGLVD